MSNLLVRREQDRSAARSHTGRFRGYVSGFTANPCWRGGDFGRSIGLYSQPSDSFRISGFDAMSRADILKKLEQHQVTATPQRLEVAEVLLERPQHLSADQILERLREGGSRVSKATVYNTLKLF